MLHLICMESSRFNRLPQIVLGDILNVLYCIKYNYLGGHIDGLGAPGYDILPGGS